MPFKSKRQRRYLWANRPDIAERWTREHGSGENLPERANGLQGQLRKRRKKHHRRR